MARKILVIEDDRDIAHLLQLHLRDLDCRVDLMYDGAQGLEQARARSYDLIILDSPASLDVLSYAALAVAT